MSKKQESKGKKTDPSTKGKSPGLDVAGLNEAFLRTGCQHNAIELLRTGSLRYVEPKVSSLVVDQPIVDVKPVRIVRRGIVWKTYWSTVWKLTMQQPIQLLDNIEKRSFTGWHIDHVLSIDEGFRRSLPPETIAHISNLRMLPAKENMVKGTRTVYTDLFNNARI